MRLDRNRGMEMEMCSVEGWEEVGRYLEEGWMWAWVELPGRRTDQLPLTALLHLYYLHLRTYLQAALHLSLLWEERDCWHQIMPGHKLSVSSGGRLDVGGLDVDGLDGCGDVMYICGGLRPYRIYLTSKAYVPQVLCDGWGAKPWTQFAKGKGRIPDGTEHSAHDDIPTLVSRGLWHSQLRRGIHPSSQTEHGSDLTTDGDAQILERSFPFQLFLHLWSSDLSCHLLACNAKRGLVDTPKEGTTSTSYSLAMDIFLCCRVTAITPLLILTSTSFNGERNPTESHSVAFLTTI